MREHSHPRRDHGREVLATHDGDDTRQSHCRRGVDCYNTRMRVRRAEECHVAHPWQIHIADIEPAPLHQPIKIWARYRFADIGVRTIEFRKYFWIGGCHAHDRRPARDRAVVSTASIMAW